MARGGGIIFCFNVFVCSKILSPAPLRFRTSYPPKTPGERMSLRRYYACVHACVRSLLHGLLMSVRACVCVWERERVRVSERESAPGPWVYVRGERPSGRESVFYARVRERYRVCVYVCVLMACV